uniref:Vesicular amine transporter n=1 Tax=Echinococcus granulosus TaxID=6210 RepID=A0A068X307_ECHGR|nr:vesicular amine transporter [Echinococcus granulosus]
MKFRQTDANSQDFFAAHPGYSMKDITEPVESLCIEKQDPGASLDDNDMEFRCELIDQMGLGSTIDVEKIIIRVFEPPVVSPLPPVLESVVNGPVSVKCSATGRPDLKIRWINEATGDVYAEEKAALPSEGELELGLTLEKVTTEQDGQRLICEASTSYPPDQVAERQYTEISVNYPPQIKFDDGPIHTALGAAENIMVTVHGKPKADLVCDHMDLSGARELEALPDEKPGVNRYLLRLQGVTEEDLGEHFCSATNKFGTAKESFFLTLAPSKPEVISPTVSSHADYYLLGWRAKSKSPLRNVTFRIQTFDNEMDVKAKAKREETRTVSLNDPMVAKVNTSSEELQEFWHHLANLTFDAKHAVHIRACNKHACNEFDLQIPDVTFRTMKEYSSNKIDPNILAQPPSAALRAAAFRDFNVVTDHALSTSSASLLILLALSFATNL